MFAWCVEPRQRLMAESYARNVAGTYFAEWTEEIVSTIAPRPGERFLDVACGAGSVATAACEQVGAHGRVAALDASSLMIAIAARRGPDVAWMRGDAHHVPIRSGALDAITCAHGLMFFEDPAAALREMARMLRPGGRIVATTWSRREKNPHEDAFAHALEGRVLGEREFFDALFRLDEPSHLRDIAREAGLRVRVTRRERVARFPDANTYWSAMADARPLAEAITALPAQDRHALRARALERMEPHRQGRGYAPPMEALVMEAWRP